MERVRAIVAQIAPEQVAILPRTRERGREEQAPGKEPCQVPRPKDPPGLLVVVMRVALAEETQHVLVDEVEVEESMYMPEGGYIAMWTAMVRIAQRRHHVPRCSNRQEEQYAGQQPELAPPPPVTCNQQKGCHRSNKEDRRDQSLRQQSKGKRGVAKIEAVRLPVSEPGQKGIQRQRQEERQDRFRNKDACEEKDAHRGQQTKRGVEGSAVAIGSPGPHPAEHRAAQHRQAHRQVGRKDVVAEEMVVNRDQPIGQRRLFKVAYAVDVQRDPVA